MKLAELSERSGVSTATIKYYLREGLLQPGRRITATQAEYGEEHLRRLRLVRALIQVGRVPVSTTREVLSALGDDSLDQHSRIGVAVQALPHAPLPAEDDPATEHARHEVAKLFERLDWDDSRGSGPSSPSYGTLLTAVAALTRLGYPCGVEELLPYARAVSQLSVTELDLVARFPDEERVEAAVALTVLYEPVLLSLRRLAETDESGRRFMNT
ncbi:MerR family transcriptional regulator [Streptomyces sp. YC504]|uniref:MerR family transcriptional regulator n=1 Tax=Streptomyces mesophilus TaxID=1775132 RepID=A0A6G4XJU1_9ACTN|nr:MerR family transcriptional regulator [Streptomyces mesophilus]NGO77097.1 MerR family transcriptional regulator [Streptomyces mesophilus]